MSEQFEDGVAAEDQEITSIEDIMKDMDGTLGKEPIVEPDVDSNVDEQVVDEPVAKEEQAPSEPEPEIENLYEANLTYSVKGEEKAFDNRLASIIKTQEDEDFIRELVTTSEGLSSYKEKLLAEEEIRKTIEQEKFDTSETLSKVQGFYQDMMENRDSKNWRGVTDAVGYTEDDILNFAIEIAKEREQPAHIQQQATQARTIEEQNKMLRANQQVLEQRQNEYDTRQQEFDTNNANEALATRQTSEMNEMIGGEYKELAEALNAKGINLFNEAVDAGSLMFNATQAVPESRAAVKAAADKYMWLLENSQAPVQQAQRKDAVPSISGGSASQVGEQITSLADLVKVSEKMNTINY